MFAPVLGPSKYNVLWQLHALDRAQRLLENHEAHRRAMYERVVVTRLDFVWLSAHPPLRYLSADCAWVPRAEDYGGLNEYVTANRTRDVGIALVVSLLTTVAPRRLV